MKFLRNILIPSLLTLLILAGSCTKEQAHDTIPNVAVDLYLDINSTLYVQLATVGGWVYLTGGYKGILVYRLSNEEFVAYDRACPYDPFEDKARLQIDYGNLTVVDTFCGSKFVIIDGSVMEGPATLPLKRYFTTFDGNILHIYN